MKAITFAAGIAAGMAMAATAVMTMYPDIPRRMVRDSHRLMRCGRRKITKLCDMLG